MTTFTRLLLALDPAISWQPLGSVRSPGLHVRSSRFNLGKSCSSLRCGTKLLKHNTRPALSTVQRWGGTPRAHVSLEESSGEKATIAERPPYFLTGAVRPRFRGQLMGWLHRKRLWYMLSVAYLAAVAVLSRGSVAPLDAFQYSLRVLSAAATCANVLISDGYHNPDQRVTKHPTAMTTQAETFWLKCDYIGISSVLTTAMWLWSSNMGWAGLLPLVCTMSGLATGAVALISAKIVPKNLGHTLVKIIMAFQFVVLMMYLKNIIVSPAMPAGASFNVMIYWIYASGLILYAVKWPQNKIFGFHEIFHTSVILGHLSSMLCDLRDVAQPCCRAIAMAARS